MTSTPKGTGFPLRAILRLRLLWLCVSCVLLASTALADEPVIERGREADVLALFAPYRLGGEIADGYKLWNVDIRSTRIEVSLETPEGKEAGLVLLHHDRAPDALLGSKSFALERNAAPDAANAVGLLVEAVRRNDDGGFWRVTRPPRPPGASVAGVRDSLRSIADGALIFVLAALMTATLVRRGTVGAGPRTVWALVAVVVAGAALRLLLARETTMAPWPYSRLAEHARAVFNGPVLGLVSRLTGASFYALDVGHWVTFAYAVLAPAAMFAHARALLGKTGVALAAAGVLAFLPQHIRFARSDVALMPSVFFVSLAFALAYGAVTDESKKWRGVATALLPLAAFGACSARPLDALHGPLLVAGVFVARGDVPRKQRLLVAVAATVGAALGAWRILGAHQEQLKDAAGGRFVEEGARVLANPTMNTLLNPAVTPPLLILAAIVGGVVLWRSGRRRVLVFLGAWILSMLWAHSYVIGENPVMQARYHLHLVTPFVLLAACSAEILIERGPKYVAVAGAYVASAPFVHWGFVRDADFAEMREYDFLRDVRDAVPEGCRILEAEPRRFDRLGLHVENGQVRFRFATEPFDASCIGTACSPPIADARCARLYKGLPCLRQDGAPACDEVERRLAPHVERSIEVPTRVYDPMAARLDPSVPSVRISLHRLGVEAGKSGSSEPGAVTR